MDNRAVFDSSRAQNLASNVNNASNSPIFQPDEPNCFDDNDILLRHRIQQIRNSQNLNERQKAASIQTLMMRHYITPDVQAPAYQDCQLERPLMNKDKAKTFHDAAKQILGCQHYQRRCKLQCSTCQAWATCRFCHNEQHPDHELIRSDTKLMMCMHCQTIQAAAQSCSHCSLKLSNYYCSICKLWDDDVNKNIYHCHDCGICRIGHGLGKDFFHCDRCNMCMSMALQNSHKCIEHSTECDCPICGEYMFSSTATVVFMSCGHSIHQKCYHDHVKTNYRCPTCSKSLRNMDSLFRQLDYQIALQAMPAPYDTWRAKILCNDCSARSIVPYHFVGAKCSNCLSYNTVETEIDRTPNMANHH